MKNYLLLLQYLSYVYFLNANQRCPKYQYMSFVDFECRAISSYKDQASLESHHNLSYCFFFEDLIHIAIGNIHAGARDRFSETIIGDASGVMRPDAVENVVSRLVCLLVNLESFYTFLLTDQRSINLGSFYIFFLYFFKVWIYPFCAWKIYRPILFFLKKV